MAPARSASTTGIGGTPRRATPAAASLPWRTTASSQPPLPSGRAPTTSARPASAVSRWARPSAPTRPASRSRPRAAASNRSCAASAVTSSARVCSGRRPHRRPAAARRDRRGVAVDVLVPGARGGAAAQLVERARPGVRVARRDAQRARSQGDGREHGVDGLARVVLRAERPERTVARCRHHRQPREGLRSGRHPPRRVRVARPAVVAGPVCRDQPQLVHARLQRVRADDRVDPLGLGDHVADAPAALARGEVAAHAPPQVAARTDVEHLVAGAAEQVHAGGGRHRPGEVALAALALRRPVRARVADQGEQLLEALDAEVADAFEQVVEHLDGGARVGQRPVRGPGGRAEQLGQRRQLHAGGLVAAQHGAGQARGAQDGRARPCGSVSLARGAQEPGVERRVVRHQDAAAEELEHRRQHLRQPRGPGHERGGDPGEGDDLRRDAGAGVDEGRELADPLAATDLDRPDLGDACRARRSRRWSRGPGRRT